MTSLGRKILQDTWRERSRTVLVVAAMTIGLTAFFSVLAMYAILRRELNHGHLATNPASAILSLDAIDDALLAAVAARDDVAAVDARRVLRGRIRVGADRWRRITLFVIRDFQNLRIATVTADGGAWPPPPGTLLIERDAFQVARAAIGDSVTIETRAGGRRTLRVSGRVHDAGQAQARMENAVYGYITPETLRLLGETPVLDRLLLVVRGDRFDAAHVERVAGRVATWLGARGQLVRRVQVPPPGEHPHAMLMGLFLVMMAAFGLIVLALSGTIILHLFLAKMAVERRQIGIMKALGASRRQIGAIYLAEAVTLGVAAIGMAVPLGIAGGYVLSERFAVLLNFTLSSHWIPAWVYALVAIVGLLVPVIAAAYPVWRGVAVSVRHALADAGTGDSRLTIGRLERVLLRFDVFAHPWFLGVRNSLRRRARTLATVTTLALAGAFFISALSVRASMIATLDRMFGAGTRDIEARYAFDQHMLMFYIFLIVVAALLAGVGGLGLTATISLNVVERRRELGILRAIGATPATIRVIVITEAIVIAMVAWLGAWAAAWPLTETLARLLTAAMFPKGLAVTFAPLGIAGWLAISLVLAIAASLVPAVRISRRPIQETITHD